MLIRFDITTERTELMEIILLTGPYNLKKADWKKFYDILRTEAISLIGMKLKDLFNEELETFAAPFQRCIINAADQSIPRTKFCARSKRWWNQELHRLRALMANAERQ
jgi:DNA topoisomerase VI subunit A